jgi:very-short-patch-repair endonuclease
VEEQVSAIEEMFALHARASHLPEPQREHRFAPPRRWRFDFAWADRMIAVEIEGGVWTGGRHTRGSGFEADAVKYNTAALMGWKVFRFTGGMVKSGAAIATVIEALKEVA